MASAPINTSYSYANTSNGLKQVHGLPLCSSNIKLSSSKLVDNGKKRVVVMMGKNADSEYAGLTALSLALAAAMVIPEMAEAAAPGVSPSLNNFLLSIASGSVVLGAIGVAVIGVSSFDPVKRN
ncbi:photosystem II reaction center protein PsbX [Enterobacter hormaechei]|uniref:photosystem II reaction center protein PsbX n=1 Tax=Enterobacter hormaechei TaxID=158836 RepID=UPI001CAA87B8|nr:photosystem II reaction center protein PsbX [Enterobacter hormaechei]